MFNSEKFDLFQQLFFIQDNFRPLEKNGALMGVRTYNTNKMHKLKRFRVINA